MIIVKLYQIMRFFLFPLIWLIGKWAPSIKSRYALERKYNIKKKNFRAQYAFQVASEGELEQVQYLIEDYVKAQLKIEIIFTSVSVAKKCEELSLKYPDKIAIYMTPLVSYFPFMENHSLRLLVSAPVICMCRYEFLPDMLELIMGRTLYIFSGSVISLNSGGFIKKRWYHEFYKRCEKLIASTPFDRVSFSELYPHLATHDFDFRQMRIIERIENKEAKYARLYPQIESLRIKLKKTKYHLILGSLWKEDLEYIAQDVWDKCLSQEMTLYILPHKLDPENQEMIIKVLESKKLIRDTHYALELTKGILCELYSEFDNAFVGGGYMGSPGVHSLLEPYLAGAKITCGPEVQRSTEYRMITEAQNRVRIVTTQEKLSLRDLSMRDDFDSEEVFLPAKAQLLIKYQEIKEFIRSSL